MSRVSPLGTRALGATASGARPARASSASVNWRRSSLAESRGELAAGRADVCAEMYPGGAPFGNRAFPARPPRDEIVETEMAELMAAVCCKDYVTAGRGRIQRAQ